MKKILLILLFTVAGYGQTIQNPTFGNTTTNTLKIKTNTEASTITKLSTQETDGTLNYIQPINVPIPFSPTNYSVSSTKIGDHFAGINTRFGQISSTSAGLTQRIYFTADNTTVTAGTFFTSSATGKGTAATGSPTALVLGDNTKGYFNKDIISIAQPAATIGYAGTYSGNLTVSATPTPNATQQRFTIEIYRCNNGGTPIASGVTGAPTGDLGVTVVAILDSGIVNLVAGAFSNVSVAGTLTQNITINSGERFRYHVSAAKIGTGGGNVTFGVYYGNSYNSYYDVPVVITTDAVINKSTVTGVTDTDALNSLNTLKANLASPNFTGSVIVPTPTLAGNAVTKAYADGLIVGLLNDRGSYNASSNVFPSTGGSGTSGSILKGDIWYVSAAGTLGGKAYAIGDSFRAIADSPGQTAANWAGLSSNIGFVPANDANVIHTTGNESKSGILTLSTGALLSAESPSTIASFDSGKNLKSLPVATYPTLTELSYVKGATSSIQTQLNGKQNTLTNPVTGTGVNGRLAFWTATNTQSSDSNLMWDNTAKIIYASRFHVLQTTNGSSGTPFFAPINTSGLVDTALAGIYGGNEFSTSFGTYLKLRVNGLSSNSPIDAITISPSGSVNVLSLAGTGTRQVVTDASGNLSATDIAPTSGTYTPTLTNIANTSSSSAILSNYTRIGNVVSVSVRFSVTESAGVTTTSFRVTLPINRTSTSAVTYIGNGVVFDGGTTGNKPALVSFDTTNNSTAVVSYRSSAAFGSVGGNVTFQYTTTE